jgi:hypothetical protein
MEHCCRQGGIDGALLLFRAGHQWSAPPPGMRPLARAEQRVQRGTERVAADGAEGTRVGDDWKPVGLSTVHVDRSSR